MNLRKIAYLFLALPAACTSVDSMVGNDPIIDTKGVDLVMYDADLSQCQGYADQVQVASKTVTGAATGAVVGGAIGAIWGNSQSAQRGAGVGAVTGAAAGASSGIKERKRVVNNCLRGRGYLVLN